MSASEKFLLAMVKRTLARSMAEIEKISNKLTKLLWQVRTIIHQTYLHVVCCSMFIPSYVSISYCSVLFTNC